MSLVVLTQHAKKELKGALYLRHLLFDKDTKTPDFVVIGKKEFPSIKRRIRNPQNKRKPIHLITQVLLGLRYRSSVKENILCFIDKYLFLVTDFVLKFNINYRYKKSVDELKFRRFFRLNEIIVEYKKRDIPVYIVNGLNSIENKKLLEKKNIDIIVLAGTPIIKDYILKLANKYVINTHSSLLPMYRGIDAEFWALDSNDVNNIGHTVHLVNTNVDDGDIIKQEKISCYESDNHYSLRYKNIIVGAKTTAKVIMKLLDDEKLNFKLNEKIKGNYYSSPNRNEIKKLMKKLNGK